MYEVCISCPKIGNPCNGANFYALTTAQQIDWIKKRKLFLGWSNAKLAEASNSPKGTIDSLLSGNRAGANTETLRPIFEALIGGYTGGKPCPNPPSEADITLEKTVSSQTDTIHQQQAKISQYEEEIAKLRAHIKHTDDLHVQDKESARKEDKNTIRFLRTVISIMTVVLVFALATIFVALLIDRFNPDIGFFWLDPQNWLGAVQQSADLL